MKKIKTEYADFSQVKNYLIFLLSKQEYSEKKLRVKLLQKTTNQEWIESAINELKEKKWQCDSRYAKIKIRNRTACGYGPLYIKMELRQENIDSNEHDDFSKSTEDWSEEARNHVEKKYGEPPYDFKKYSKIVNLLMRRGFTQDHWYGWLRYKK